jgi:hypothetical protein
MDARKARISKLLQFFHGFLSQRLGPGVTGDPLDGGKFFFQVFEDLYEVRSLGDQRIGILKEGLTAPEIEPSSHALKGLVGPAGLAEENPQNLLIYSTGKTHPPGGLANLVRNGFHLVNVFFDFFD